GVEPGPHRLTSATPHPGRLPARTAPDSSQGKRARTTAPTAEHRRTARQRPPLIPAPPWRSSAAAAAVTLRLVGLGVSESSRATRRWAVRLEDGGASALQ